MADNAVPPTLYAHRPEWTDLTPVPQDDTPSPLASIAYKPDYIDAMNMFRAVVRANEHSQRVLDLTFDIIQMNAGHYSVWAYRFQTLLKTGADLNKELDMLEPLVKVHLKTYQVWQHRRNIVTALSSPTRELPFISRALTIDSKNYHTWAYRQWLLKHFDLPELWTGEDQFVEHMLRIDIRNNSAWNHRWFVVVERLGEGEKEREEGLGKEIEYTEKKIADVPHNPSAWNYLRGLLAHPTCPRPLSTLTSFVTPLVPCVYAVEFLADALSEEIESDPSSSASTSSAREALDMYERLANELDPIRKPYWSFKQRQLQAVAGAA